eukprot:COSAG02_NODE_5951_length_3917_cov_29.217391_2_plen_342_part_00
MAPYRRQRQSQQSVLKRALRYVELHPKDPDAYDIFDDVEGLRVIVDYKWKMFARRRHLEQFRRLIWTMLLQRLLATPTAFGPVSELPIWEYVVMAALVANSLSPTLNFCTRLCIVEGWRNLLVVDSAASWVDVGWASAIAWDIVYTLSVRHDLHELEGKRLSSLQAWTLALLWARMFLFLIPFKLGRFVLIIVETVRQLKYFLALLAFFILAFTDVMFEAQSADRAVRAATSHTNEDSISVWRAYMDNWFSVCEYRPVAPTQYAQAACSAKVCTQDPQYLGCVLYCVGACRHVWGGGRPWGCDAGCSEPESAHALCGLHSVIVRADYRHVEYAHCYNDAHL